jgi:hypothetical protein
MDTTTGAQPVRQIKAIMASNIAQALVANKAQRLPSNDPKIVMNAPNEFDFEIRLSVAIAEQIYKLTLD